MCVYVCSLSINIMFNFAWKSRAELIIDSFSSRGQQGQHRKTKETPLWYFIKKLQETFAHRLVFTEILLLSAIEESFFLNYLPKNVPGFTYSIFLCLAGHKRAFLYSQKLFSNKAARQIVKFPFYTCILYWTVVALKILLNAGSSLITTGVVVVTLLWLFFTPKNIRQNITATLKLCVTATGA